MSNEIIFWLFARPLQVLGQINPWSNPTDSQEIILGMTLACQLLYPLLAAGKPKKEPGPSISPITMHAP